MIDEQTTEHGIDIKTFNGVERDKIRHIIQEGIQVTDQLTELRGGLNDAIKAVAEELELKPSVIRKAIRAAYKNSQEQDAKDQQTIEQILAAAGR